MSVAQCAAPEPEPGSGTDSLTKDVSVQRLLERLKRKYAGRITGELATPAAAARYAELPSCRAPCTRNCVTH